MFQRFLNGVERVGNSLPHPATLFAVLAVLVVLASGLLHSLGLSVTNPATGKLVQVVNLVSVDGLQRMITEVVRNFLSYPPLGISLTCLLGIGLAEHSGLMWAGLRLIMMGSPVRYVTPVVVFAGVVSHTASEIGYILLTPLAAALYHALGRHPLLGLAAAFSGVCGGYSANIAIGSADVLLAGLTEAAARIVDPSYTVNAFANWYFNFVSAFMITLAGTWVTEKIVAPRLGAYRGGAAREELKPLTAVEKRGLWAALGTAVLLAGIVAWGVLPTDGFLVNPNRPGFADSTFMAGLVTFIFIFGLLPGIIYGVTVGTIRSDHDVMNSMTATLKSMSPFILLAFFASQFVAYFNWTNLGVITAVGGAELIRHVGWHEQPIPLMIVVVFFSSAMELVMSSASAKWALLAPILVPMFMLLGYSPEMVQGAYRIGDSVTGIVTPLMSYFPLILAFVQRYEPKAGIGTMIATMLPYAVVFLLAWTGLLVAWIALGWPMGPDAPLYLAK